MLPRCYARNLHADQRHTGHVRRCWRAGVAVPGLTPSEVPSRACWERPPHKPARALPRALNPSLHCSLPNRRKAKDREEEKERQEMIKLAQAKKPTWTAAAMYVAAAAACTTARDAGQLPAGRPRRRDLAGRPPQCHCAHGQLGMVVIRHSFAAHRPPVTSHLQQRKKKG